MTGDDTYTLFTVMLLWPDCHALRVT